MSEKTECPAFDVVEGWGTLALQAVHSALGLFLVGRRFSAFEADQGQEIPGVERVAAHGLLSGGAESDVYAAIVGEDEDSEIDQHLLALFRRDVGILGDLFLGLLGGELILFPVGAGVNVVRGNAVLHEEALSALDAAFCKALVIYRAAAWIGMAAEDEMGFRFEGQIACEVGGQFHENLFLAAEQASSGIGRCRTSGRKINAMKREPRFELDLLRRRRRLLDFNSQLAVGGTTAAIIDVAVHGVVAGS